MTRSSMREHVFKMLFSYEFDLGTSIDEHMADYLDEFQVKEQDRLYMINRIHRLLEVKGEIDKKIKAHGGKWEIERIAKVDLAIIRLGIYEAIYDEDIPVTVAVNEAVELAKRYGGDQSPKFVHGLIGACINE